jgi:hypothetical protein
VVVAVSDEERYPFTLNVWPHTETVEDAIRNIWREQLHLQSAKLDREIFGMFTLNDRWRGWPRQFVLFPRLDRWQRSLRWRSSDVHAWWRARPEWLGGNGLPDVW